jgi:hypothetical protein
LLLVELCFSGVFYSRILVPQYACGVAVSMELSRGQWGQGVQAWRAGVLDFSCDDPWGTCRWSKQPQQVNTKIQEQWRSRSSQWPSYGSWCVGAGRKFDNLRRKVAPSSCSSSCSQPGSQFTISALKLNEYTWRLCFILLNLILILKCCQMNLGCHFKWGIILCYFDWKFLLILFFWSHSHRTLCLYLESFFRSSVQGLELIANARELR